MLNKLKSFLTIATVGNVDSSSGERLDRLAKGDVDSSGEKFSIGEGGVDSSSGKKFNRLTKYDNLRGLGIIIVVLAHVMNPFASFDIFGSSEKLLMMLCMPLLFFVSGYFSKVDENTEIKAFKGILIPYILFATLWIISTILVFGGSFPDYPYLVPSRGLWYLLTLFFMRLFLPIFIKIKHVFWLMVIAALVIGFITVPNNILAISKAIYYLPLFMLGYYFKNSDYYLEKMNSKVKTVLLTLKDFIITHKYLVFGFLVIFCIAITLLFSDLPTGFLSFEYGYHRMKIGNKIGMLLRLAVFLSSILMVVLLNYLMTDKNTFLTKLGMNSLAIYVLHFYFTRSLDVFFFKSELGISLKNDIYLSSVYIVIVTISILFILSRDFVTNGLNRAINLVKDSILNYDSK